MGLLNRLIILQSFLRAPARIRPGVRDLIANGLLKPPSGRLAPRFITGIEEAGDVLRVAIEGCSRPLCWPRALPLAELHRVVTECCYPADWHYYEVAETRVQPGDVVLDCGAAEGLFALRAADRAARVIAFEPQPAWGESLRATFAGAAHVEVRGEAVGASPGRVRFSGGSLTGRIDASGGGVEVPMTSIDAWRAASDRPVSYLKADLEGHELAMLQGAVATLAADRPRLAITVYHPGNDWRAMQALLAGLVPGYRFRIKGLYGYDGTPVRPVMLHAWT